MKGFIPVDNKVSLQTLKPFVSKDIQNEIDAVAKILELFPGKSLKELVSTFVKYQKERRTSPEGMADRLQHFRDQCWPEEETPESLEAILGDYRKLTAAKVKLMAKKLNINLNNPKDEAEIAAVQSWLTGGPQPPTEAEKIAAVIQMQSQKILDLMDQRRQKSISIDQCVAQCKAIVTAVQKQYKQPGLIALGNQIQVPGNPGDTAAKLSKELQKFFDDRGQKWKRDLDIDPGV